MIFPPVDCHHCRSAYPREAGHFIFNEVGAHNVLGCGDNNHTDIDRPIFSGMLEVSIDALNTLKRSRNREGHASSPIIKKKILSMEFNVVKHSASFPSQVALGLREENKLKSKELAQLAGQISAIYIDRIAIEWLDFEMHEVQSIRRSHTQEEQWSVIFDILQTWQNRNDADDEREVRTLLLRRSKPDIYGCLLELASVKNGCLTPLVMNRLAVSRSSRAQQAQKFETCYDSSNGI